MRIYIIKRLAWFPIVLMGVVTIVFFLTHLVPGSAIRILLGPHATEAMLQHATKEYGLDKPLVYQYGIYLWKVLHGDLGRSIITGRTVIADLAIYLPATIELVITSLIIITVVGITLGVVAAVYKNGMLDFLARGVAVGGVSMPQFWLGLMVVLLFFYWLGILPAGGKIDPNIGAPHHITGLYTLDSLLTGNWAAFKSTLLHLILPAITLSLTNLSTTTRMTRSSMLRTLREDYITMARAYGFGGFRVNFIYALKNALIPVASVLGLTTGYLFGGAFLIETVFDWPGIGLYATRSILNVDYAPVVGVALLTSFIYVAINIVTDIIYPLIDPRIKY